MKNDAVFNLLPEEELLAQLAEECSEAFSNFVEELADIYLCSIVLFGGELDDDDPCNMCDAVGDRMVEIMEQKLARWKYRLMKKEEVDVPEE